MLSACDGQLGTSGSQALKGGEASAASDAGTPSPLDPRGPGAGQGADAALDEGGQGDPLSGADAGPSFPAGVPVFVATGHMGRTLISCDDGESWLHDVSADDSARCFTNDLDCDHSAHGNTGLVYLDGTFVATFGWGAPGTIRRTQDGLTWQTTLDETNSDNGTTFSGLTAGGGLVLAGARNSKVSSDLGATWGNAGDTQLGDNIYNVRAGGYASVSGGRFVLVAEDQERAVRISADGGKSFRAPTSIPDTCARSVLEIASNGSVIVLPGRNGIVCSSSDVGDTWQATDLFVDSEGDLSSGAIWAGQQFLLWGYKSGQGRVTFVSDNGKDWTSLAASAVTVGPVAYSPLSGTFVTVNDDWQGWYDKQRFYRSKDGVNWTELVAGKYKGGHPIRNIAFGTIAQGAACP